MFFALAGNDRAAFDRVLGWTRQNLAQGDLAAHLPAWLWGKNKDGEWKPLDTNPAADADVWMAYTLLEAGRLWNLSSYTLQGKAMLALIAKSEVAELPGFGPMLLPAPSGFQHDKSWMLNPSYLPCFLFERLAVYDPAGPWKKIATGIPRLLNESARHGYAMDWIDYVPGDGFYPAVLPAQPNPGSGPVAGWAGGSYDAIRVYLWAGMLDGHDALRPAVLNAVPALGAYLADHDAPPEKISDQGIPLEQDGPVGFSAAALPYLRAYPDLSKAMVRQLARLNAQRDPKSGLYGKNIAYYDQNLALFATGFLEDRFRFGATGELIVGWKRK
jgi:endoglucanase